MSPFWQQLVARWAAQREVGLLVLIAVTTLVVGLNDPVFWSAANWLDILVRCAPVMIIACGVMLVVITAHIDISVGSLLAVLAAVLGRLLSQDELAWPLWAGVPVVLATGTLLGAVTGMIVTFGRVPSIIVTLGLLTALRGLTTWGMAGRNIGNLPETLSVAAKQGIAGVPLGVIAAAAVVLWTWLLLNRTSLGLRLYALGSSAYGAKMIGLPRHRLEVFVFAHTGFLTALATIVDVPRLPKIEAGIGADLELLVVTCVVVGGVSIAGGRGRVAGVILAVLFLTMIRPVLTFLNVGESGEKWAKAIQGLFIMLAIISDSLAARSNRAGELR